MTVEIDEHSGFCFGVVNAIRKAEQELERGELYCIGDIVHNDLEVWRLEEKGVAHHRARGVRGVAGLPGAVPGARGAAGVFTGRRGRTGWR